MEETKKVPTNPITELVKDEHSQSSKDRGDRDIRDDKKDKGGKRFRKDRHGRHGNRFNHHRSNRDFTRRFDDGDSHIKYQPKMGKEQTLDLQIYAGSEIRSNGLYPISGKDLPKKDISIDWFKEVPATANGALNNMATNFQNTDIELGILESETLDYVNIQMTVPTYAQLPHPSWIQIQNGAVINNLNPGQPWPGYNATHYTSYSTMRSIQLRNQTNTMLVAMQTNQSFSELVALNYWICPYVSGATADTTVNDAINAATDDTFIQDQNPFWGQSYNIGLIGWIDGVNTAMLTAVTLYYNIQRTKVLLEYFIKRHNTFAPYLKTARGFLDNKRFTAVVEALRDELSYIYCDTKWVNDHAKALLAISKSTDTVWSPLIITTGYIMNPAYSMVGNNGNGLWFSLAYGNQNGRDGAVRPYYTNNEGTWIPNPAVDLLQQLQQITFNANGVVQGNALQQAVQTWQLTTMMNYVHDLLQNIQSLKQQLSGYNSLIEQARASGLIWYEKKKWAMEDAEVEIKYIPQIAIPLQHPECMITGVQNASGQFSASIALEGADIEKSLVDSTRYYSICPEWFFNMQINNFNDNMPVFIHTLQFDVIEVVNADTGDYNIENAAVAGNGTVAGVFQLPEIIMYGWVEVHCLNGAQFRFRHWKNYAQQLDVSNAGNGGYYHETITWRGVWALSNGEIYVDNNGDYQVQDFYTNYGFGGNDPVLIESFWISSFSNLIKELGVMTCDSSGNDPDGNIAQQNYVTTVQVRQNYTISMPVTMRNTDVEMLVSLIQNSMLVSPIKSDDIGGLTKVQLVTPNK